MSAPANSLTPALSQGSLFLGACKRCGSANLHTKIEPPHIALRCKDCGAWQQWVSKSKARAITDARRSSPQPEAYPQVPKSDFDLAPAVLRNAPAPDLADRIERVEKEIEKINRELLLYFRVLSGGKLTESEAGR